MVDNHDRDTVEWGGREGAICAEGGVESGSPPTVAPQTFQNITYNTIILAQRESLYLEGSR